jgi:hypothetical protein
MKMRWLLTPTMLVALAGCYSAVQEKEYEPVPVLMQAKRPGPADYPYAAAEFFSRESRLMAVGEADVKRQLAVREALVDKYLNTLYRIDNDPSLSPIERDSASKIYMSRINTLREEITREKSSLRDLSGAQSDYLMMRHNAQIKGRKVEGGEVTGPGY